MTSIKQEMTTTRNCRLERWSLPLRVDMAVSKPSRKVLCIKPRANAESSELSAKIQMKSMSYVRANTFFWGGLFRAAPAAYGGSRARGPIRAAAYTTATARSDLSCICDPHSSSWQCRILNPLSKASDQTLILMGTSWILNPLSHNRNS